MLGWVYVGNQNSASSVQAALMETHVPVLDSERNFKGKSIGMKDRIVYDDSSTRLRSSLPQIFLGFSIARDDLSPGPIFNHARVWSYRNATKHIVEAYLVLTAKQDQRKTVNGHQWEEDPDRWDRNLQWTPEQMSQYNPTSHKNCSPCRSMRQLLQI